MRSAEKPEGQWYPVGSDLGGWTITQIGMDEANLAANGEALTLKLFARSQDVASEASGAAQAQRVKGNPEPIPEPGGQ